jgi:histidinol-phosphate aminotransferase
MYSVSARINQINLIESSLNVDFSIDTERLLKDAQGSKLLFICSPNNPTGQSFPKNQLIEILTRFNGIVVIDEAYIDFADDESMLNELSIYPNLVVCQTFSKAYGMAGIRLGMLFASPEIINWMNKIKPPYNINQLTQTFAFDKLGNLNQVQLEIDSIKKERSFLLKELAGIQCVEKVYPSDSNFILIKVKNAVDCYNYLKNNGIVIRNRSSQLLCENCLRLTIGTPEENLLLCKTLKEIVN